MLLFFLTVTWIPFDHIKNLTHKKKNINLKIYQWCQFEQIFPAFISNLFFLFLFLFLQLFKLKLKLKKKLKGLKVELGYKL